MFLVKHFDARKAHDLNLKYQSNMNIISYSNCVLFSCVKYKKIMKWLAMNCQLMRKLGENTTFLWSIVYILSI